MAVSRLCLIGLLGLLSCCDKQPQVSVGSLQFTESYVLGEIAKRLLREHGFSVEHRQGMGGNAIPWQALTGGGIQMYPTYTGTIQEVILKAKEPLSRDDMLAGLQKLGVGMTNELGFNNTYAMVMRRIRAKQLGLKKISDLKAHPELRVGVTHEFLARQDGWAPLCDFYDLTFDQVRGMDHALSYQALLEGEIDMMDGYSTDAKILEYDLVALEDDRNYFPKYQAVFIYRLDLDPAAVAVIRLLEATLDETRMIRLNTEAERTADHTAAAALYFEETPKRVSGKSPSRNILSWTLRHLVLVGTSLLIAILVGIPIGIRAARADFFSQVILGFTGLVQTIPSLALLALLVSIPFLGISLPTAIVALFLYSLLPIVRNTATGIQNITPSLVESARVLGLEPMTRLLKIYLPLASPMILAGIKTSAVINVGTATLAALIGVGGLGEPIISGLSLNDRNTILQGAVPAAVLAILVQFFFEFLERLVIPKGLRLKGTHKDQTSSTLLKKK